MVDMTDVASEREALMLADALERQRRAAAPAQVEALFCEDCDAPIPLARREAVACCRTCVACQSVREGRR